MQIDSAYQRKLIKLCNQSEVVETLHKSKRHGKYRVINQYIEKRFIKYRNHIYIFDIIFTDIHNLTQITINIFDLHYNYINTRSIS